MKFSVVLIARNESKTLPRLVESLKEFQGRGGEIILLDTGSTDGTPQVARSLGCFVKEVGDAYRITIDKETADAINAKFVAEGEEPVVEAGQSLFDYASARNYAATLASNDMIATPDCDEIYTKLDLDALNSKIEAGTEQFEYQFVFAHDALGKPLVQFLHSKFYNRTKLKWVGIVHEVLSGPAKREYLPESVIKLEHYQNVETNRNGYLTGLALDCFKNPENDRNAHYFARELMYKNRFKSAIQAFRIHIDMKKWPEERAQSMLYTGDCYNYIGNTDEMFKWYVKAMDTCPDRREPLMKLAEYYFRKNSPKHVIMYVEAALTVTGSSFYSNYQPYYAHLPHELLYWAYWYAGNKAKSKEHYDIAYSMVPTNPKYIQERHFYYTEKSKALRKDAVIVQIGTNKGDDELSPIIKDNKDNIGNLILVEPLSLHNKAIEANYNEIANKHIENIVILKEESSVPIPFFYHKNDGPDYEVASLTREHILKHEAVNPKITKDGIVETTVPGLTLNQLFDKHNLSDIDVLFIDAEGMDDVMIYSIDFSRFNIGTLYFENCHINSEKLNLFLTELGYEITKNTGKNGWMNTAVKTKESLLDILTAKIESGKPFNFVKRGDGELACMNGDQGANCDGHPYSTELGIKLKKSFNLLKDKAHIVEFDDQTNYNILLHRTDNDPSNFWKAVRNSSRKKLFVGPGKLSGVTRILKCRFLEIPEKNVFSIYKELLQALKEEDATTIIFAAGMVTKCLIADLQQDSLTLIDAGSAFDPLAGQTRTNQMSKDELNNLYREFKNFPQESHPERLFAVKHSKGVIYDLGCGSHKTLPEAIGVDLKDSADVQASIDKLPFEDNSADTVISRHSLEHMKDPAAAVKEWLRVLKPSGKLVIVVPDDEFIDTMDPFYGNGEHYTAFNRTFFKEFMSQFPVAITNLDTVVEDWSFGAVLQKLPVVSIVIPNLGRPEGLQRCLKSIGKLNYPQELIETIIEEGPASVPEKMVKLVAQSTGDFILFGSNDIEFLPDSLITAVNECIEKDLKFLSFNTGPVLSDLGNICEHFMIYKDIIPELEKGEIFSTDMNHVGVDNYLWAQMEKLGYAYKSENAVIKHHHFTKGAQWDDTYSKGWNEETVKKDREILKQKLEQLV